MEKIIKNLWQAAMSVVVVALFTACATDTPEVEMVILLVANPKPLWSVKISIDSNRAFLLKKGSPIPIKTIFVVMLSIPNPQTHGKHLFLEHWQQLASVKSIFSKVLLPTIKRM